MTSPAEHLPNDLDALRAIIAAQASQIQELSRSNRAYEALVDALRVQIVRLKKQKFGASSEKIARSIEQLELALEGLEVARASIDQSNVDKNEVTAPPPNTPQPRRRGKPVLSEHVLSERRTLDPGSHCPDCGGELRLVGEDVSEILDLVQAQLKRIEIARPKKSCRKCEAMVQSPAPTRPVARGMAGPGLLALSWSASMTTTFRSTGKARSLPAWAPIFRARR